MRIYREPTSPGEILEAEFLRPLKLSQKELANHVACNIKVSNRIVNGRASVTAEMAVRLAAALGTTPEFWLNAQQAVDLFRATRHLTRLPKTIRHAGG